jgi:uncharacterized membrane protein (UPF0136 family)
MNDTIQFSRDDALVQGYLTILESWLEVATKQEIQARQSRSSLVFATLASGVGLVALIMESDYETYVPVPLALMVICSIILNHYYQLKAASWKKTSRQVALRQKLVILSKSIPEMEQELTSFNIHQSYKDERKKLWKIYPDVPSTLLYITLVAFFSPYYQCFSTFLLSLRYSILRT